MQTKLLYGSGSKLRREKSRSITEFFGQKSGCNLEKYGSGSVKISTKTKVQVEKNTISGSGLDPVFWICICGNKKFKN